MFTKGATRKLLDNVIPLRRAPLDLQLAPALATLRVFCATPSLIKLNTIPNVPNIE